MRSMNVIAACALLGLVLFARVPGRERWATELTDFAHGPAFAALTVLLFQMVRARRSRTRPVLDEYVVVVVAALLLGAMVELAQGVLGRDASVADLWRDAQGTTAATGFTAMLDPRLGGRIGRRPAQLAGLLLGLTGTLLLAWPAAVACVAHVQRNRAFPVVVDFERPASLHFVQALGAARIRRDRLPPRFAGDARQAHALHIEAAGRAWWGVMLREPVPDWRSRERLAVMLANPAPEPLRIAITIHQGTAGEDLAPLGNILVVPPRSLLTHTVPLTEPAAGDVATGGGLAFVHGLMLERKGFSRRPAELYVIRAWLE